jgi:hypothetical protein
MTGECTEDQFWAEVERIGWKDKNPKKFYKKIELDLLTRWDNEFIENFRNHMSTFTSKLSRAIERVEHSEGVSCGCGDDGFSDLIHHVVGLGRETFERELADPMLAIKRGKEYRYVESFSYAIPYEREVKEELTYAEAVEKVTKRHDERHDDYYDGKLDPLERESYIETQALTLMQGDRAKLDPRYYMSWAKRDLVDLRALAASPYADAFEDLPEVLAILEALALGTLPEDFEGLKKKARKLRDERETFHRKKKNELAVLEGNHASLENLFGDMTDYLG